MPPKEKKATEPSASDHKFFYIMFKHLPRGVEMDWKAFATEMEFKDVHIAKMRFGQIRNKFNVGKPASNGHQAVSKVTKPIKSTSPKKRKGARKGRGKMEESTDDDDDVKKPVIKKEHGDDAKDEIKVEDEDDNFNRDMGHRALAVDV